MSNVIYRYDEAPRTRLSRIVCAIGNGFAIFGLIAFIALIVDTAFFNNQGLINFLIWVWEITNNV